MQTSKNFMLKNITKQSQRGIKTMQFRMRISLLDYLNKYIKTLNAIFVINEKINKNKYKSFDDIAWDLKRFNIGVEDIGAQIIAGYMEDIAERAIELNDEKLLELLQGLKVISKTEEKEVQDAEHT